MNQIIINNFYSRLYTFINVEIQVFIDYIKINKVNTIILDMNGTVLIEDVQYFTLKMDKKDYVYLINNAVIKKIIEIITHNYFHLTNFLILL